MQPDNNDASIAAATKLKYDGICDFDLALNSACLKPIARISNTFGVSIFIGSVTVQLSR